MRNDILTILKKARDGVLKDIDNSPLSISLADCLQRGIHSMSPKKVTRHTCPDERCRVAFWLEIDLGHSYQLIVELSKLEKYARLYWKKKTLLSAEYSSTLPPENQIAYRAHIQAIEELLSHCKIILLSSDELSEEVPFEVDEYNPDDNATVGSLIFAPEYH